MILGAVYLSDFVIGMLPVILIALFGAMLGPERLTVTYFWLAVLIAPFLDFVLTGGSGIVALQKRRRSPHTPPLR
jgi:hypothetical protein